MRNSAVVTARIPLSLMAKYNESVQKHGPLVMSQLIAEGLRRVLEEIDEYPKDAELYRPKSA